MLLYPAAMDAERIDFISAYCDRWCERCAFTARCSAYACHIAVDMCGDFAEGLELAVGRPRPEPGDPEEPDARDWLADFDNAPPFRASTSPGADVHERKDVIRRRR